MPEPVIDSRQQSAIRSVDSPVLVPPTDRREEVSGGSQISLTQFAAEISAALKQSGGINTRALQPLMDLFQGSTTREDERGLGIAVHSSLMMELLGTDNTPVEQCAADEVHEKPLPLPALPEPVETSPVKAAAMENSATPPSPAKSDAPAAPARENRSNTVSASPLPISAVIDSAVRAISILKLKLSSVISVTRAEDGWRVAMELVERAGVPDTSDVLGVYELRLDGAGNVVAYERTRMRRRCDLTG